VHLASLDFLARHQDSVRLATYDRRMRDAARALGFAVAEL
jgi:hypothetical protein